MSGIRVLFQGHCFPERNSQEGGYVNNHGVILTLPLVWGICN